MEVKYTRHFLIKIEDIFSESDYVLRYEKGNFKSGFCILRDSKVVVINKFYDLEGKINCLMEILKNIDLSTDRFSAKNLAFYQELKS